MGSIDCAGDLRGRLLCRTVTTDTRQVHLRGVALVLSSTERVMRSDLAVVLCSLLFLVGCGGGPSQPPVANASGPYTGTAGTAMSFSGAASSDPQGETLTYAW